MDKDLEKDLITANAKKRFNSFFVNCFYSILGAEERSLQILSNGKLTLKEIHVLETVFDSLPAGENKFSAIAKKLRVTLGTLTTTFNNLARKGYLTKTQDSRDKRVFYIFPTRLAELINEEHAKFHELMIDGILFTLNENQQEHLIIALKKLTEFFDDLN